MAMDDTRTSNFADQPQRNGVGPLAPNEPRMPDNPDPQSPDPLFTRPVTEGHQPRRNYLGHVSGEFQYVTFGSSYHAVLPVE